MKILAIMGSYRRKGNTDQVLCMTVEQLQRLGEQRGAAVEIETIYLGRSEVQACRGCRVCFDRGEEYCPIHDDFLAIKEKMRAADGMIVASPVYVDDVNGLTKTWIDRLGHVCHRPEFAGKCAELIVTSGSSPSSHSLRTLNLALSTWGFHITGQSSFKMGALMKAADSRAQFEAQTEKIARRLFTAIERGQYRNPTFLALMMFRIYQTVWGKALFAGSVDQAYWQGQGWLDPRRTFYIDQRANPFKVGAARLVGGVIARFVS